MKKIQNSYKKSGVNISLANKLVKHISNLSKKNVKKTNSNFNKEVIGGFGSIFDISKENIKDPLIVSCTDGVGTKVDLANKFNKFNTIGIDLVAMCVNDLIVQGAKPLFFLDYIAVGKLNYKKTKQILSGIFKGCKLANCSLIGGETAEMPGIYNKSDFDLAGFSIGAHERGNELPKNVSEGDIVFGLRSSGIHSNGFSLVRKIVERSGLTWNSACPFDSGKLGEVMLAPTRLYVRPCLKALKTKAVHAFAHITGGGLHENIPRVLREGQGIEINLNSWERPAVFRWLAKEGEIAESEMLKTFNCGIGMVAIVAPSDKERVRKALSVEGQEVIEIGCVSGLPGVRYKGKF